MTPCSSNSHLWNHEPAQLVTDPEEETAASLISLRTSNAGIAKWKEHNPCSSVRKHKRGVSPLCPARPLHLASKKCVQSHVLFYMGNALLEWIFWLSSLTAEWFASQSGLGARELDSFQVNLNWKMLQKHCRNTPDVLQTLMDQMVHGTWLELVWSKCLEITLAYKRGPQHQPCHFIDLLLLGHASCLRNTAKGFKHCDSTIKFIICMIGWRYEMVRLRDNFPLVQRRGSQLFQVKTWMQ